MVLALAALTTACEGNFKEVQKMSFAEFMHSGEADDFNLRYTDSSRITSISVSPKMRDFSNVAFPFTEFPKGVDVTIFDKNGEKTFVKADYGVSYKLTNIIDLQGNVRISTEKGQLLETEQLYYDQKHEWFYTEKKFKFTDPKGISHGDGVDFSKDFRVVNSQRISAELERSNSL